MSAQGRVALRSVKPPRRGFKGFTTVEEMMERLPTRAEVALPDTWDLDSLFKDDTAWEAAFREWEALLPGYERFRGQLGEGALRLAECLRFDTSVDRLGDQVGTYAFLKATEDVANSTYQGLKARFQGVASKAGELASFIRPELLALPDATIASYLASPELSAYRLTLERLLRFKPHTLSDKEERLLAMQAETAQTASQVFDQLLNADLKSRPTLPKGRGWVVSYDHSFLLDALFNLGFPIA